MRRPPPLAELPRYPVTGGTILLAAVASIAYWKGIDVTRLMETPAIGRGQWWRLITSALPHANLMHLAFNAYWIWVFGTLIEQSFGPLKTAAIFVLLAGVSGAAEYAILAGGIGLSGVGYGLFGMVWVLSRRGRDRQFADAIDSQTIALFVAWFFLCIGLTVTGAMPVANIAHGAGAAAGALLGWAICVPATRAIAAGCLVLFAASSIAGATVGRPLVNVERFTAQGKAMAAGEALSRGDNEKAIALYRDVVKATPRRADCWYNLGVAYGRQRQYDQAIPAFAHATALEPADAQYRAAHGSAVGYIATRNQRWSEAIGGYEEATEADDSDAGSWFSLGNAYMQADRRAEGIAAYQHACTLDPDNAEYRDALKSGGS